MIFNFTHYSDLEAWLRGCKTLFMLNSTKHEIYIMLINVKMQIVHGILTFISMINTIFESLKAKYIFHFSAFGFYEQLKINAHLS